MNKTLFYVHDPMCSWCWAFQTVWKTLQQLLPEDIKVVYLLGGLAPDSSEPMTKAMQRNIQQHWRRIEKEVPHIRFNFDFWTQNIPQRSTYPACRAVIAAKLQNPELEQAMIGQIQTAYYMHAANPSQDMVLCACAQTLGLNTKQFQRDLHSQRSQALLMQDMQHAQRLQATGFPNLIFQQGKQTHQIPIDYINVQVILQHIERRVGYLGSPPLSR